MKTRIMLLLVVIMSLTVVRAGVPEDQGAMGLAQALSRMDVVASVLHTGAHPDDENSALLAWLSRGEGVRTAYLSATRGEGGQNLLGPELFEGLGVIRTEELLAARRLDASQQFFTPNYEFGFSKNAEEGLTKWGHQQILGDYVRVIRQFRPEIIISRFTGTPTDGHGHHQVSGIITQEAFKAAADPMQFPEYGRPWQAKKLYLNPQSNNTQAAGATPAATIPAPVTIAINVGKYDSSLGRSYNEIAAEGRSMHRSQSQGAAQEKGPRTIQLQLVQKTVDTAADAPLFSGVLYKLADLGQIETSLSTGLKDLEQRVAAIREKVNLLKPAGIVTDLVGALKLLRQIQSRATNEHVQFLLKQKEADFEEAARLASGLVLDVVVSDDTVVPGQEFDLTVSLVNGGPYEFTGVKAKTELPAGWDAVAQPSTANLLPGQRLDLKYKVKVSANADFTQPYWLREPRRGDRFVWPAGMTRLTPIDPPLLSTTVEVDYQGTSISMTQPAEFRRIDRMLGEQRVQLKVVPALSVRVTPGIAVIPLKGNRQKELTVGVENQSPAPTDADVRLVIPAGWTATPVSQAVKFSRQGEKASLQFTISAPATAGDFTIQAIAKVGSLEFRNGYAAIAYPHIETRHIYSPAEAKVEVLDVATTITSVGYVEGTGDLVPDSLRQLGITVTMLSPKDIATGDLSQFPAIVLGVRAYGVRDDLRAYNKRLLDYVEKGGNLIVQYNRGEELANMQLGPYPFTVPTTNVNNTVRVTREDAPVKLIDPTNSVLNVPNKINAADFLGWVDERGTYFLQNWDPKYSALLESHDPEEPERQGGLVVGKYGKGSYVYTGYAFFRQLPAGVKGAYRLFANFVSIEN